MDWIYPDERCTWGAVVNTAVNPGYKTERNFLTG
jgi:hypothetical protein